jgi:hypothetical protein
MKAFDPLGGEPQRSNCFWWCRGSALDDLSAREA